MKNFLLFYVSISHLNFRRLTWMEPELKTMKVTWSIFTLKKFFVFHAVIEFSHASASTFKRLSKIFVKFMLWEILCFCDSPRENLKNWTKTNIFMLWLFFFSSSVRLRLSCGDHLLLVAFLHRFTKRSRQITMHKRSCAINRKEHRSKSKAWPNCHLSSVISSIKVTGLLHKACKVQKQKKILSFLTVSAAFWTFHKTK